MMGQIIFDEEYSAEEFTGIQFCERRIKKFIEKFGTMLV
jgi:hypothetical protein